MMAPWPIIQWRVLPPEYQNSVLWEPALSKRRRQHNRCGGALSKFEIRTLRRYPTVVKTGPTLVTRKGERCAETFELELKSRLERSVSTAVSWYITQCNYKLKGGLYTDSKRMQRPWLWRCGRQTKTEPTAEQPNSEPYSLVKRAHNRWIKERKRLFNAVVLKRLNRTSRVCFVHTCVGKLCFGFDATQIRLLCVNIQWLSTLSTINLFGMLKCNDWVATC